MRDRGALTNGRDTSGWLVAKRLLDLVVGIPLALLAIPVIVILAAAVALTLREWPIFVQERLGKNGRLFRCPKLRTLPRHTPPYASKYAIPLPERGFEAFLRRKHLDELPQLLLVPFGKLSLVGPRPKMPDEFEPAPEVYGAHRVTVPQGCTGLWQVGQHTGGTVSESPQYDLTYIANASVPLDLWILWRTALVVTGLGKPVALDELPHWTRKGELEEPVYVHAAEADA